MKKCYIQNLAMIITNKCNLDCCHCLKGKKDNSCMTDKVIEATFNQIIGVGNLSICGGEATMVLERLEKLISYVIKKNILLDEFTITINGTIFSEELLRLLDEIDNYIGKKTVSSLLAISLDKFHLQEIERLGIMEQFLENLKKYKENKHFYMYRTITEKLFREGNAIHLDKKYTVPLRPTKTFITYALKGKKQDLQNGLCNIGPIVSINPDGMVTECDASTQNQRKFYNYGNVLDNSIEEIMIKNGAKILKPKVFVKQTAKELEKYLHYNK